MESAGRGVHSVEKAAALLDCLWQAGTSLSLGQLARETGWAKSTVHGLLKAMTASAIVEQDPRDGSYRLGYHLFELGSAACVCWDAAALIRPCMEQVAGQLGQSVVLARRCGDDLLVVTGIRPEGGLPLPRPGTRLSWALSSQGRCILAGLAPEEAARLLPEGKLQSLRTCLTLLREMGYTIERGELKSGQQSIGAPIYSADGCCHYAISVIEPQRSWQSGLDRSAAACIREAAAAASKKLCSRAENG